VTHRRPILALAAAGAALALPSAAQAAVIEVGQVPTAPKANCPTNCLVVSRTTGYQAKVGPTRGLMTIPRDGRIVAWTVTLGAPGRRQIQFFNSRLGGEATAQITVLRRGSRLRGRVMAQGEPMKLAPYFGTTAQFPLERSLPVKKGWVVALTVPTWAPVLGDGLGGDTSWRASRPKGGCDDTTAPTAQTRTNQLAQYWCLYRTARLAYSATLVTTPRRKAATTTSSRSPARR
jgi:hypothetical protein